MGFTRFIYKAKTQPGKIINGEIEAENENIALAKLNEMGYFTISLEENAFGGQAFSPALSATGRKINLNDLCIFTRQLSDLFESGLTLVRALDIVYQQTENKRLRSLILDIINQVRDGISFSQSLAKHKKVFSSLYVNMVKSGEASGSLDKMLSRLASLLEKDQEFIFRVRSASAYPALMLFVGFLTIFILMTFVIPRLVGMFNEVGQVLPLPTQILISTCHFLSKSWVILITSFFLVFILMRRYYHSEEGKLKIDSFKLSIPIWGDFLRKFELARFSRTLGTLLANGVPILESLAIVVKILENEVLKKEILKIDKAIEEGSSLSKEMAKSREFPSFLSNMLAIGEEAGTIDASLLKIASTYEAETDRKLKTITSLIEPLLILILGSIVGFIVIAMLLPIFQISFITG